MISAVTGLNPECHRNVKEGETDRQTQPEGCVRGPKGTDGSGEETEGFPKEVSGKQWHYEVNILE